MTLGLADTLFFIGFGGIWLVLVYWIFLGTGSAIYSARLSRRQEGYSLPTNPPLVSILVPAHNEALVIESSLRSLAAQDYPEERFEIIVVNDGSQDATGDILSRLARELPNVVVHEVPPGQGAKGKSRTLNIGLTRSRGSLIAVFDADNTPEPDCLRRLVATLVADDELVAVNAKVRTRNTDATWLTRFINLEYIFFQWLFQGGRWHWFRLSMLMGTGYVIYRDALDLLGGFDEKSLVDDTEMSLRIFRGQRRIRWVPYAVSWEQEPEDLRSWLRQRTRWSMGNLSVTWKYLPAAFVYPYPLGLEILTFAFTYVFFVPALLASDLVFLLGITGMSTVRLPGPFTLMWGLAYLVYVLQMVYAIQHEDRRPSNYLYAALSYFTYAQLFLIVLFRALYGLIAQRLRGGEIRWAKTARHKEP
jgi:cellulose synthase/poly-beta-1,6-N-acetylglucosamine synthase-like glycosyltransferase